MSDLNQLDPIDPIVVNAELDPYPTANLQERYGIGKTTVNERLNVLGIERIKRGTRTFVSLDDLQLLDDLQTHLQRGGQMSDFPGAIVERSVGSSERPYTPAALPNGHNLAQTTWGFLTSPLEEVAQIVLNGLKEILVSPPPAKRGMRLAPLRELEEAYRNGWLLSSAEVADLLGLTSGTVTGYSEQFSDRGFQFRRVGKCRGGQIAWSVGKTLLPASFSASSTDDEQLLAD